MARKLLPTALALSALASWTAASAAPPEADRKPARTYKACPRDKVWSESQGGCVCAPGLAWDDAARKCAATAPPATGRGEPAPPKARVEPPAKTCPQGQRWSEAHDGCVVACPRGTVSDAKGKACVSVARACRAGEVWNERQGACTPTCPAGAALDERGACVTTSASEDEPAEETTAVACAAGTQWDEARRRCTPVCPAGTTLDERGAACVTPSKTCPAGKEYKRAFGGCVPACGPGEVLDFYGVSCHPIRSPRRRR